VSKFSDIENKWQELWQKENCFEPIQEPSRPNRFYSFDSAPFPNGRIHVGHIRNYILGDVLARYKRLKGFDVLHVTNFDAFGLPNELAAELCMEDPHVYTLRQIKQFRDDLQRLGISYAWSYVKSTCDPNYYQWTQWLFLKLYSSGLIELRKSESPWCPHCRTTISHHNIEGGLCERCENAVEIKEKTHWVIRTSQFSENLFSSIEQLNGWSPRAKKLLSSFFSTTEGYYATAFIEGNSEAVLFDVFIPKTINSFSCAKVVSSLDSSVTNILLELNGGVAKNREIIGFINGKRKARTGGPLRESSVDDTLLDTGIKIKINGFDVCLPLWISCNMDTTVGPQLIVNGNACSGDLIKDLEHAGLELSKVYLTRDWCVSRSRDWGTPIPILNCPQCGPIPVPEELLPMLHRSHSTTAQVYKCSHCGSAAQPVEETLDCFFDDCWCFISGAARDMDANPFLSSEALNWLPANYFHAGYDTYVYLHIYQLISYLLHKQNLLLEPIQFISYSGHDIIKTGGKKISKRYKNGPRFAELIENYGADVLRLSVVLDTGPSKPLEWNDHITKRAQRYLSEFTDMADDVTNHISNISAAGITLTDNDRLLVERELDAMLDKTSRFIEGYRPNAALNVIQESIREFHINFSGFKENNLIALNDVPWLSSQLKKFIICLSPFVPHICEELWERLGGGGYVSVASWPN